MRETYSLLPAIGPAYRRSLSQAMFPTRSFRNPKEYPANRFVIGSSGPGTYVLSIFFDYPSDYQVDLFVQHADDSATTNNSTYYVSSGSLELDVNAQFSQPATPPVAIIIAIGNSPMAEFCELAEQIRGGFSTMGKVGLPNPWDSIPHGRWPLDPAGDRDKRILERSTMTPATELSFGLT